jgi:hypothetical protein
MTWTALVGRLFRPAMQDQSRASMHPLQSADQMAGDEYLEGQEWQQARPGDIPVPVLHSPDRYLG